MTTEIQETMAQPVGEGGNAILTAYFEVGGIYIPVGSISSLKFWLDDEATGVTINSRTNVEVKNANGGTLAEVVETVDGVPNITRTKLTLLLGPADNPVLNQTLRTEYHLGTLKGFYNGGAGMVPKEFLIRVINMSRTP